MNDIKELIINSIAEFAPEYVQYGAVDNNPATTASVCAFYQKKYKSAVNTIKDIALNIKSIDGSILIEESADKATELMTIRKNLIKRFKNQVNTMANFQCAYVRYFAILKNIDPENNMIEFLKLDSRFDFTCSDVYECEPDTTVEATPGLAANMKVGNSQEQSDQ